MTRDQIEALTVGMNLSHTTNTHPLSHPRYGKPLDNARWSDPRPITRISYRGVSVKGLAYVGGYTLLSENAEISFSISEGDKTYRTV